MPTLNEVKAQMRAVGGPNGWASPETIKDLPNVLFPDERIVSAITGKYLGNGGLAVATDRRVLFVNRNRSSRGNKVIVKVFAYNKITSVEARTGLANGKLTIFATGTSAEIDSVPNDKLRRFAETTRSLMSGGGSKLLSTQSVASAQLDSPRRRRVLTDKVKTFVWRKDDGKCVECGSQELLEYDHVIPFSMGGSDTARNLQRLCEGCNRSKGGRL